jgi:hypothetical protein
MLRSSLHRAVARANSHASALTSPASSLRYASGHSEPKGNATGLASETKDGMKPGKDNTSKEPAHTQDPTPNVEGGEGQEAHPATRPAPQPEPTRSTGIKRKEEMG